MNRRLLPLLFVVGLVAGFHTATRPSEAGCTYTLTAPVLPQTQTSNQMSGGGTANCTSVGQYAVNIAPRYEQGGTWHDATGCDNGGPELCFHWAPGDAFFDTPYTLWQSGTGNHSIGKCWSGDFQGYCDQLGLRYYMNQSPVCSYNWKLQGFVFDHNFQQIGQVHLGPITNHTC